MLNRMDQIVLATLCASFLGFLAASSTHAQGQAKTLLLGRADARISVDVVVDTEQGSRLDHERAKQVRELMAETEWQVLENGQLQISKKNPPVLAALQFTNQDKTFFLIHARTPRALVNGEMFSFSDNPTKGWATVFVDAPGSDGKSLITIRMGVPLTLTKPGDVTFPPFPGFGG